MKRTEKKQLVTRIVAISLVALMLLGVAYTAIYFVLQML
jgi:hypothetical protein